MAVREIIRIGHKALKAKNRKVVKFASPKVRQVIKDLIDTMLANDLIGIAAPQIAENYQIFITQPRETETRPKDRADDLRIYINPKLVELSKQEVEIWEGCGSVPDIFGPVKAPRVVTVEAYNQEGKRFRFSADGILGRVIFHEQKHLEGIEFIQRMTEYQRLLAKEHYLKKIRNSPRWIKVQKIFIKKFVSL